MSAEDICPYILDRHWTFILCLSLKKNVRKKIKLGQAHRFHTTTIFKFERIEVVFTKSMSLSQFNLKKKLTFGTFKISFFGVDRFEMIS